MEEGDVRVRQPGRWSICVEACCSSLPEGHGQRGLSYCLSICRLSVSQPWGPYLASFLTHSNLEITVGPPRVSPRRREWGFKCEARLWVLTHLRYPEQDQRPGFLITHPPREDRTGRDGNGV